MAERKERKEGKWSLVGTKKGSMVKKGLTGTRGQKKTKKGGPLSLPPMINNTITIHHTKLRYFMASGGGSTVSVSIADMLGALGGICTVTNSVFKPWAGSFRIKRIRMWNGINSSGADESQCVLSWNSGTAGMQRDELKSEDVPQGATTTGMCEFKPPAKSLAGDWVCSTATASNLFSFSGSQGTIIDLEVAFTLSLAFVAATITITTGTLGGIYYLALDGAASNLVVPCHLPTTH